MRTILIIPALLFFVLAAQAQPPATDIYLFDLAITKENMKAARPVRITSHKGYDNQPFFHPDKPLLYYVSANDEGRTDIFVLDYETQQTRQLTKTQEREYSPIVTPDGKFISCIIQRDNGQQDLGKYPIDGGEPEIIINDLKIGYHAWLDSDNVIVFVLGEPNSLIQYTISTRKQVKVSDNPGRSLLRISAIGKVLYVDKRNDPWVIRIAGNPVPVHKVLAPNAEDMAVTPDGGVLMSNGNKIYFHPKGRLTDNWDEVITEENPGVKGISRMAVNAAGDKLAVVVNE